MIDVRKLFVNPVHNDMDGAMGAPSGTFHDIQMAFLEDVLGLLISVGRCGDIMKIKHHIEEGHSGLQLDNEATVTLSHFARAYIFAYAFLSGNATVVATHSRGKEMSEARFYMAAIASQQIIETLGQVISQLGIRYAMAVQANGGSLAGKSFPQYAEEKAGEFETAAEYARAIFGKAWEDGNTFNEQDMINIVDAAIEQAGLSLEDERDLI